jgi:hypothetical protein
MVAMVIDAQAAARGALSARARPDLATKEVMEAMIRVAAGPL